MVSTPRSTHHHSGGGGTPAKAKPTLEILPDTRFIVFHGGEHESPSVRLTGRVRFTAPEAMSILKPKVRLEGKRKIGWWYMGGIGTGEVTDKRVFWNQEQRLGIESSHKVKAGILEWPFEFELAPSMPESVEGLKETYIVYHLHASVSRPGWNAKDLQAQEHIRIVRTLGQDSMEMTRSRVNADIWANKISYSISIPSDAVVFGTSITADVELSPIKKGLRLGKIELRLIETTIKRIQASEVPDVRVDRTKTEESEVAKADMDFPEHSRITYDDETVDNPTQADEMYKFKATLPLPKSLNVCRQDVDSHQINITHRFKLMVNIHNPEGHTSQLVCRLPVKLFISPNLPVDERNEVMGNVMPGLSDESLNNAETTLVAPPEYGRHMLDQIYSDIDPAGYMSRAGSVPGTPGGLYAQSRRTSHENLASLNGMANGLINGDVVNGHVNSSSSSPPPNHGSATPSVLHSRLADLQEREHGSSVASLSNPSSREHSFSGPSSFSNRFTSTASNGNHSGTPSPAPGLINGSPDQSRENSLPSPSSYFPTSSRRESDENAAPAAVYDMSTLTRVPSYGAALRTPTGSMTPYTAGPPSYVEATSRPPTPPEAVLQRPSRAHLVSRRSSGASSQQTAVPVGFGAGRRGERTSFHDDGEARLRALRAART